MLSYIMNVMYLGTVVCTAGLSAHNKSFLMSESYLLINLYVL